MPTDDYLIDTTILVDVLRDNSTEAISSTALSWFTRFHLSHGIGFLDVLIDATALHQGAIVATLNMKHFTPLPGVQVKRPY